MSKKQTAAQVLAHKRALKAAQMKRYRDRQRQEDGLQHFSLLETSEGKWRIYEGTVQVGFDCSSRPVALEIAVNLEERGLDIVPLRRKRVL